MVPDVEIIATRIIKPSCPTPQDRRSFNFSLLDQISPPLYLHLVFFYQAPSADEGGQQLTASAISNKLKDSLSEVLTLFFPFAGRFEDNAFVNCNDDGVPCYEAKVSCALSDMLKEPDIIATKRFVQINLDIVTPVSIPLVVQLSFFECGGVAIGISVSHKIADVSTLSTFAHSWAVTALGHEKASVPDFTISSVLRPADSLKSKDRKTIVLDESDSVVTKRFVFDTSSITSLKAKLAGITNSRILAVSSLIWKSAITTKRLITSASKSKIMAFHAADMRKRTEPPFQENSIGNFSSIFGKEKDYTTDLELSDLVENMKDGLIEFCDSYVKELRGSNNSTCIFNYREKIGQVFNREDIEKYSFSSWCDRHFYDTDFGWGKPAWVTSTPGMIPNFIVLMDAKEGDGIEAMVKLTPQHMSVFERDRDFLAFAKSNPSILEN